MSSTSTVFYGTFIDLPRTKSGDKHVLSVRHGALWVSADGAIQGADWTVANERDLHALLRRKGWVASDAGHTSSLTSKAQGKVHLVRAQSSQNEFFFPGFIDTHIHAPQYPNSGLFGSSTLLDWLERYTFPMESSFASPSSMPSLPPPTAFRVYNQTITRTLAHGTTYAAYYATIHVPATQLLASLCVQRGQKALIGRVCMDNPTFCPDTLRDASPEASLAANDAVITHIRAIDPSAALVRPVLTPRFAPTCSPAAMRGIADQAARHAAKDGPLHIQTHISENTAEIATVREFFPEQDSYAAVYDAFGLLTPRTILAHAVHLTPAEQGLVSARGAKVSHCPASNSALGSGLCPVRRILDAGVTVGLGTDVSGGYSSSVLEAVRQACLVSRLVRFAGPATADEEEGKRMVLSVEEALYLATRGGAAVVDAADQVGGFEEGMLFDAQLVRLGPGVGKRAAAEESPVDVFGWESWEEKVHKWVWNGDDRNVKGVWVNGRLVHSRGDVGGESGGRLLRWVIGLGVVGVGAVVAWRYRR